MKVLNMRRVEKLKRLIRELKNVGLIESQKDFGKKLGYDNESYFSQIINGSVQEPKDFIQRIKLAFPKADMSILEDDVNDTIPGSDNANTFDRLLDEIAAQRKLTEKALEQTDQALKQNDRLITLLEKEAERTEVIIEKKRV